MKKAIKSMKVLFAIALAIILSVPANSFAADGEGTVNSKKAQITKTINVEENVLVPASKFEFEVSPLTPLNAEKYQEITVQEDKLNLLKGGEISFTQGDESKTKTLDLTVGDLSNVTPGVYKYQVKESTPTEKVDGMIYDSQSYELYLIVTQEKEGKVANYVIKDAKNDAKTKLDFTNTYQTSNLTVKKIIEGNAADMSKKFNITITVNGVEGETYATNKDGVTFKSGEAKDIELGNDESIIIYGLSPEDTYTVVEKEDVKGDYTAKNEVETAEKMGENDKTVTITNELKATVPTGLIETIAPFAIMILVALGLGLVYFRKRQEA